MPNKIQYIALLQLLLISCRFAPANDNNESASKISLQTIINKDGYTAKGWNQVNALFRQKGFADLPSALLYYNYAATFFNNSLNYQRGILYADSLLRIVNRPEYENTFFKEKAEANINKAHSLYFLKQHKDCYYYYYCGMTEAGKIHDSALNANLNQHMCLFLYEEGYYGKAIGYYRKLLVDATGVTKTWQQVMNNQGVYDNMGLAFLKDNQTDSAQVYFRKAIQCLQDVAVSDPSQEELRRSALGTVYGNLGQAYATKSQYDSAEYLYKANIAINGQPGFANEDALITQQYLAELYYRKKELPVLYTTLSAIGEGLDTIKNKKVSLCWTSLMNKYYTTIRQPEKALYYLEKNIALRDSVKNAQLLVKNHTDIFDQMKILEARYDISLMKKDSQVSQIYLVVAVSLCILIFIIAALIFSYFKKEKRNVSVLTSLNNQIHQKQALLQSTLAQLEKENREKQHILHVVAHDLRNPIAAIQTLAGMTEDDYEDEESGRENLELIKNACSEGIELINGILEIAENEEVTYVCSPVHTGDLLLKNLPLLRLKAADKNQRIGLTITGEPGTISADAEKMKRVINNVVINAIKFSPSGSVIDIALHTSADDVLIQVKDTGIGIPEKYRSSIFNAFTEAKRTGTEGEKAFGLGLSISRQIVEKHHGTIGFESEEGKGTTFFIRLPRFAESTVLTGHTVTTEMVTGG